MMRFERFRLLAFLPMAFVALMLVSTDFAEARRGGSFGSRGFRTQQTVPPTQTAPNQTGPVERSMSPSTNPAARQQQTAGQAQRPGMFSGLGGGLMRGLLIGGLLGMLLGYGFGGMAGALGFLVQLLLIGGLIWLAMAFFRSRRQPAAAGGAPAGDAAFGWPSRRDAAPSPAADRPASGSFAIPRIGSGAPAAAPVTREITLDQDDLDMFERRLGEVQRAFADEDHAALRRLSTPEMVSFFSEELAENAKRGVRNEVSGLRLLQADIAEAWNEGEEDYATAAFRYEAVEVLRDRATGALAGGIEEPTETVELWTFVRKQGGDWKLSAIQEASA